MGREFELKYAATEAELALLRSRYPQLTPIAMETTYYDTPAGTLGKLHWTLRRRTENGKSVCTLKTPLPDGSRGEWETENTDLAAGVRQLCAMGAPKEILDYVNCGVAPFCGAKFTRLAKTMELPGGCVELALDEGVLLGGGQEKPFAEVEVELKSGEDGVAAAFAEDLAREFGLVPELKSKLARAMELAL